MWFIFCLSLSIGCSWILCCRWWQWLKAAFTNSIQLRLQPFLSDMDLPTIIHAFINSRLDYCNMLYIGLPLKTILKLQLVHNAVAHLLKGVGKQEHITPVLQGLHQYPVFFWVQFKVTILTYKALKGLDHMYLRDCLLPYTPSQSPRSA